MRSMTGGATASGGFPAAGHGALAAESEQADVDSGSQALRSGSSKPCRSFSINAEGSRSHSGVRLGLLVSSLQDRVRSAQGLAAVGSSLGNR